jgi:plasmid stabilization system protein ParE
VPKTAYRVDLTDRAARDLQHLYRTIDAENSAQARAWFNGLERVILSLEQNPARGAVIREDANLRQLLYGRRRYIYRIVYAIDEPGSVVSVLHIRRGARDALTPGEVR